MTVWDLLACIPTIKNKVSAHVILLHVNMYVTTSTATASQTARKARVWRSKIPAIARRYRETGVRQNRIKTTNITAPLPKCFQLNRKWTTSTRQQEIVHRPKQPRLCKHSLISVLTSVQTPQLNYRTTSTVLPHRQSPPPAQSHTVRLTPRHLPYYMSANVHLKTPGTLHTTCMPIFTWNRWLKNQWNRPHCPTCHNTSSVINSYSITCSAYYKLVLA